MNPAASNLASSFLMASLFFVENLHSHCFFGVAVGLTFRECSINSFGTPGISAGFHANTSRLALTKLTSVVSQKKEVDERAFLFVSEPCSNQRCF